MSPAERLYRLLLAVALPRGTPRAQREEMVEVFLDLRSRAGEDGPWAVLLLWLRLVVDLGVTGVAERIGAGADERKSTEQGEGDMGGGVRQDRKRSGGALGAAGMGQALRAVMRAPARTAVAALTLGLGVGAATLVAVLARDVLLAPLPYEEGERLLRLRELDEERRPWWPSRANFEDWRAVGAPGVDGIEAIAVPEPLPVLLRGRAVRADVVRASSGFLDLVGAGLVRGRAPTRAEWGPGGEPVAVTSHAFWRQELGGEPLSEETLLIGNRVYPVVGVLEPGFGFLGQGGGWSRPDVWIALETEEDRQGRQSHGIHVVARAAPGVGVERADRALDAMAARVAGTHGEPTHAHSVLTTSLEEDLLGAARRPLTLLLLAAGGVLLVVGLNLSGAFLVDGLGRTRELQVRRALGAGRLHIVGQLLGEAAVSALPGALLGFAVAGGGLALARRLDPGALPRMGQVSVDPGIFLFAVAVGVGVALLSAALPGILLSGDRATRSVAAMARSGPGRGLRRLWTGMIAAQVALTFALLVGSVALSRSLVSLLDADLGFETEGVVAVQAVLPSSRYTGPEEVERWYVRALEAARGLPGVAAASVVNVLPHETQAMIAGTTDPDDDSDRFVWAGVRTVDPSYFDVLGIPLLRGEYPPAGEPLQVLVDRTVERSILGGDAVGRRVRSGGTGGAAGVTGVVGPVREWGLEMGAIGTLYVDYREAPSLLAEGYLLVRGVEGRRPPAAALRSALQSLDPQVPLTLEPLSAAMGRTLGARRLVLAVVVGFGVVGLLLAGVGIYGVVAYVTRRRLRESGVRLALGARPGRVRGRVVLRAMLPTAAGLAVGGGLAWALLRAAEGRVEGLDGADPVAFAVAALLLLSASLLAGWIPARWTTRVELARVLREE